MPLSFCMRPTFLYILTITKNNYKYCIRQRGFSLSHSVHTPICFSTPKNIGPPLKKPNFFAPLNILSRFFIQNKCLPPKKLYSLICFWINISLHVNIQNPSVNSGNYHSARSSHTPLRPKFGLHTTHTHTNS